MSDGAAPRILVVDDERDLLIVIKTVLKGRGGFDIETCGDSREAVARAVDLNPDAVMLDFMMPGMTGEETLAALRANPQTENLPVIFMTARHDLPDGLLQQKNVLGVIEKPFDQRTLADQVRALLEQSGTDTNAAAADPTISELLEKYRKELPDRIQALEDAWAQARTDRDEKALENAIMLAHRLSGTGATFGFPAVADIAQKIETALQATSLASPDADAIAGHIAALRDAAT